MYIYIYIYMYIHISSDLVDAVHLVAPDVPA